MAIRIGIDRHRFNAHFLASAHDAHSDLAPVGYEYLFDHASAFESGFVFDKTSLEEYHLLLMSALAHIDSLRFAKSGERLAGTLKADALPRLADMLALDDGAVQYQLSGLIRAGRPTLRLQVQATVWLTCQHCLEKFPAPLELDSELPIARNEGELERWEKDDPMLDALVADPRQEVAALVEDEILLGLPLAPHHPEGECRAGSLA